MLGIMVTYTAYYTKIQYSFSYCNVLMLNKTSCLLNFCIMQIVMVFHTHNESTIIQVFLSAFAEGIIMKLILKN